MAVDTEQIGWQLRSARLVEKLLRKQLADPDLPILRWTVDSVGCGIVAEPQARDKASREYAVREWAARLGLEIREAQAGPDVTNLVAHGAVEDVYRVVIHTTLYDDEEGGSDART